MRIRLLLAALLAAAVTAGTDAGAAAVAAPVAGEAGPLLVVAPRASGLVTAGRPMDVDVRITNTGTTPLPAGDLAFSVQAGPAASSTELVDAIANPAKVLLGQLLSTTAKTPVIQPGAAAEVRARISAQDLTENLTAANGARLLYVRLRTAGVQVVAESALTKMAANAPQVGLGTIVPVTAPAGTTGLVDTTAQAALTGPTGAWTQALAAARAMPSAALALDPAVIASIRLAGTAAPASATAFLADLRGLPNEAVRLPYADGDLTLQRAAGLSRVLTPSSFTGTSVASAAAPSATPSVTPNPAPTGRAAAANLTDWNWSSTKAAWPVPGTSTGADVAALAADATVVLGSAEVGDTPARAAAGPLATVRGSKVLVADGAVSGLMAAAAGTDRAVAGSATAALIGALATEAVTREAPAVLAVAGRGADPAGLARVLGLLAAQGWLRGDPLPTLTAQARPVAVELRGGSIPTDRIESARALVQAERSLLRLGSAVADPERLTAQYRLALAGVLSAQWRRDEAGWSTAAATTVQSFDAVPKQIALAGLDPRIAIGSDGILKFTVTNRLTQPITVVVTPSVDNGRLQFAEDRSVRVTVPAEASAPGVLHFRPIANGRTDVTLTLSGRDGAQISGPSTVAVTVQAGIDVIVAIVVLTALGLLLALGVYRNIVRRRRPRRPAVS